MERLTERELYDGKVCYTKCAKTNCPDKCAYCDIPKEAAKKLKEYEDLEEQGLLRKFPYKVRDTVYVFLPDDYYFTVAQINKIEIKPTLYGEICYFIEPVLERGNLYRFFEDDFGKTVFLTQAEAEEALKGMEEG